MINSAPALLAIDVGFMGPTYAIATACATSNYCLCAAANHIREGEADLMIAGGVESSFVSVAVGALAASTTTSTRNACCILFPHCWVAVVSGGDSGGGGGSGDSGGGSGGEGGYKNKLKNDLQISFLKFS
ncbi:3-oxoacyl-[acyl-carrier-protein] synthase I, chloroplastic [Tanacetum coccineum]